MNQHSPEKEKIYRAACGRHAFGVRGTPYGEHFRPGFQNRLPSLSPAQVRTPVPPEVIMVFNLNYVKIVANHQVTLTNPP
jgi:hypothetical protein